MGRIFIMGDIHGLASNFTSRINFYIPEPQEDDIIICLGDVGLEYGNQVQGSLRKAMSKFPGTIYIMRGNHDNRYWANHVEFREVYTDYLAYPIGQYRFDDNEYPKLLYHKKYPNIKYIFDGGGVYNIEGYNILFIPGAYSVDKYHRLDNNLPYEPREQLTWLECEHIFSDIDIIHSLGEDIHFVCSHTAPLCIQPYFKDLFLSFIDQSKVDNYMERFLDEVYAAVGKDMKRWYFGHYHDDRNVSLNFTMLYHQMVQLGEKL
jgi:3-oxoacid CoA-transferase subunit A